jgi:uncharacterized protein YgbK (DUF1537 family)
MSIDTNSFVQRINKAFSFSKKDPEVFLMLARKCTEQILNHVFQENVGKPGPKATIETYLSGLNGKIPDRVILNARIIQSFGNYCVHSSEVNMESDFSDGDVSPAESALSNLARWFLKEYLMMTWIPIESIQYDKEDDVSENVDDERCNAVLPRVFPRERKEDEIDFCLKSLANRDSDIIILEDDPAGFPSNLTIPMIVDQSLDNMEWLLEQIKKYHIGYISTPSRSLNPYEAMDLFYESSKTATELAKNRTDKLSWVSRSDSCLRGHFAEEMNGLRNGIRDGGGNEFDLEVFVPAYVQQGRITYNGIQYIRIGSEFMPACNTEYARVPEFEYKDITLRDFLISKYKNRLRYEDIYLIKLEELREKELMALTDRLVSLPTNSLIIFDAVSENDLAVISYLITTVEARGRNVVTRCSPGIIPFLSGVSASSNIDLRKEYANFEFGNRGVILSGSLSKITKVQTRELRNKKKIATVIIDVDQLWQSNNRRMEVKSARNKVKEFLNNGFNCLVTTNVWQSELTAYPSVSKKSTVLSSLGDIISDICDDIGWIITKGSDTGFEVLRWGIQVSKAFYLGSIIPGGTFCKITDEESQMFGKPIVLFQGNSGVEQSLCRLVDILCGNS